MINTRIENANAGFKRNRSMKALFVLGLFALLMSPLQAREPNEVAVTQLLCTSRTSSGQPIVLPRKDAQIVASVYDIMPGAAEPIHNHPYPRFGYVLAGILKVTNIDTGQIDIYKPGSFFPESVGQWHSASNIGGEPLKLLVIDFIEEGQSNIVPIK